MFKNLSFVALLSGLKFTKHLIISFFDMFFQMFLNLKLFITHYKVYKQLKVLGCPLEQMKESYMHVEYKHLEIFPFSGLLIQNTHRLLDVFPQITAIDDSKESLNTLIFTLEGSFCPVTPIVADINTFDYSFEEKFNSISLNFALDKIQGGPQKVESFILRMKILLNDSGIVFGITTMGIGITHKKAALEYIKEKNQNKQWFNIDYSVNELEEVLKNNFDQYGIINVGSCILFRAIINKKIPDVSAHRPTFESLKNKHLKINPEDFSKWVKK